MAKQIPKHPTNMSPSRYRGLFQHCHSRTSINLTFPQCRTPHHPWLTLFHILLYQTYLCWNNSGPAFVQSSTPPTRRPSLQIHSCRPLVLYSLRLSSTHPYRNCSSSMATVMQLAVAHRSYSPLISLIRWCPGEICLRRAAALLSKPCRQRRHRQHKH